MTVRRSAMSHRPDETPASIVGLMALMMVLIAIPSPAIA
jgi:hypothetical protein